MSELEIKSMTLRFEEKKYKEITTQSPIIVDPQNVPDFNTNKPDNTYNILPQTPVMSPSSENLTLTGTAPVEVNMSYLIGFILTIHIGSFHYGKAI